MDKRNVLSCFQRFSLHNRHSLSIIEVRKSNKQAIKQMHLGWAKNGAQKWGGLPCSLFFSALALKYIFFTCFLKCMLLRLTKILFTYLDIYNVCSGVAKMYDGLCTLSSSLTIWVVFPSLKKDIKKLLALHKNKQS